MKPSDLQTLYQRLRQEADKVIVGLEEPFELLVVALLTGGHVLLEGVPGTAKTLMAKTLAHIVQAKFTRIQFTPDLMPSDILGTSVFDITTGKFYLKKGPIFTNIVLADEINRAPAKTQSALLEAMEERQVNLEGERHPLEPPFMVVATQNPIEYEGTFPLPEAQLDRFLMRLSLGYPGEGDERQILLNLWREHPITKLEKVVSGVELPVLQKQVWDVHVDETLQKYVVALAAATRDHSDLALGVSPRGSLALFKAAQALAAVRGREHVIPDDIKYLVPFTLSHRLIVSPEAQLRGQTAQAILEEVLKNTPLDLGSVAH